MAASPTGKTTWPTSTVLRLLRNDAYEGWVYYNGTEPVPDRRPASHSPQAVAITTPIPGDELLAVELTRLDRKIDNADAERRRLVNLHQAGVIDLSELQRRTGDVAARQSDLQTKRVNLADQRSALACGNQLRRRITDFAAQLCQIIDQLANVHKQQLLWLLIEEVRVTDSQVQIQLRIALDPPDHTGNTPAAEPTAPRSTNPNFQGHP